MKQSKSPLPRYGIHVSGKEIYVGSFSRNYAGDYVRGFRIVLENIEMLRGITADGISLVETLSILAKECTEGEFSLSQYTLSGSRPLEKSDYDTLKPILASRVRSDVKTQPF